VTAAIVLWNTGMPVDDELLQYLSPLGCEHINLTGDCAWRQSRRLEDGSFSTTNVRKNLASLYPEFRGRLD